MREKLRPQIERVGDMAIIPVAGALARRPDPFEIAWGAFEDTDSIRGLGGAGRCRRGCGRYPPGC